MRLHLWGTDFRRSTSEFRSRLFIPLENRQRWLRELLDLGFVDCVYLSTCNRVEFYTTGEDYFKDSRSLWLRLLKKLHLTEDDFYKGYHLEGKGALRHLMRVAGSLESLVIGEPQILGQLKVALQWSKENGLTPHLNLEKSFQLAFETAKRCRRDTLIGQSTVSIASLGLQRAQHWEAEIPMKKILVVGRSPMSLAVIDWMKKNRPLARIVWANRNLKVLETYPESAGVEICDLKQVLSHPPDFSHLFTATSSSHPLFSNSFFEKLSAGRRLVFDFAEPPDVASDVKKQGNSHIELISMGELGEEARANSASRQGAVSVAEKIIEENIKEFCLQSKEAPVVKDFSKLEPLFLMELERMLENIRKDLPSELHPKIKEMAYKLVKRNVHLSREFLRESLRNRVLNPSSGVRDVETAFESICPSSQRSLPTVV